MLLRRCVRFYSSTMPHTKNALVMIADGSEEMEAVTVVDVLRRGGVNVTVAGLNGTAPVRCSRGVVVVPDAAFSAVQNDAFDVIVLPGGGDGAKAFAASDPLKARIKDQADKGKLVAAICAAPIALHAAKVGFGHKMTSYPSVRDQIEKDVTYVEDNVVVDRNIITSRGPGTAIEFALELVEQLVSKQKRTEVAKPMLV